MNRQTRLYICLLAGGAAALMSAAMLRPDFADPLRFLGYLLIAALASACKVRIPGLEGIYSLNFLVILAAVSELRLPELLIMAAACAVTQSYWRAARQPRFAQVAFNVSNLVITIAGVYLIYHASNLWPEHWKFLSVVLAALGYYALNTGMTAIVLSLVEGSGFKQVWNHWAFYTLPYYLLGSSLAAAWSFCDRRARIQEMLLSILLVFLIYRVFRSFVLSQSQAQERPAS